VGHLRVPQQVDVGLGNLELVAGLAVTHHLVRVRVEHEREGAVEDERLAALDHTTSQVSFFFMGHARKRGRPKDASDSLP